METAMTFPDYEAAGVEYLTRLHEKDKVNIKRIVDAALGDKILYIKEWNDHTDDGWPRSVETVKVWPKEDSDA
jgi:hypothetical protein